MYRIEIRPGEETALRTIEELAVGIRNGVITSRARIWHNAGQKWLPIEFHPHYRAALEQLEADESELGVAASTPIAASKPVAAQTPVPVCAPAPMSKPAAVESRVNAAPAATAAVEADRPAAAPAASPRRNVARPIGLLAVGCLVIASAKLATSKMSFDTARASAMDTPAAADVRPADDSRRTSALPATVARPAVPAAAPKPIAGGGVVHGPAQVPPPAPPASRVVTEDTIPSAPRITAPDLTLPAENAAPEAAVTTPDRDSIAR